MGKSSKNEAGKMDRRAFLWELGSASAVAAVGKGVDSQSRSTVGPGLPAPAPSGPPPLTLRETSTVNSGIPLGGIGAGSIEIRPDGTLQDWLIFNMGSLARWKPPGQTKWPDAHITDHSLAFFAWAKRDGEGPVVRHLDLDGHQQNLFSLGWAQCVEGIEFAGQFPQARLRYRDDTLPVKIESSFFSPFAPHDARLSGTPGFHAIFTITNPGKEPVSCSLMARLHNPLASGAADNAARKLANSIVIKGQTCWLVMQTGSLLQERETVGSLSLSFTGGQPSYIIEDFNRYLWDGHRFQGPFGKLYQSFLVPFRQSGRLPSLPAAGCPANLLQLNQEQIKALTAEQAAKVIAALRQTPSLRSILDMAEKVNPAYVRGSMMTETLLEMSDVLNEYAGKNRSALEFGDAALCTSIRLKPGETVEIPAAFSWYFPYHISARGPELGHQYEHWFSDALEVNQYLVANGAQHRQKVTTFTNALAASDLPDETRFCWSSQLSTLIKNSWWLRDGGFAVFEGLGCCALDTVDVSYEGSASILALFPELQKNQMELTARYQRPNGQVPHNFMRDFSSSSINPNSWSRADINPDFIMIVCRDYLWTGDKNYLARMWPRVKKILNYMASLDEDGDGLPEKDTSICSYDAMRFQGTPSYIGSLWLGAYSAAKRMAQDTGDQATMRKMEDLLARATASFNKKLWNGSYYNLMFDKGVSDPCCMTDQISGIWFTSLAGLKPALSEARVRQVLAKIFSENFDPEQGLVNSSYPEGTTPRFPAYMNLQLTANWTGVEYAVASFFLEYGMTQEALAIVQAVHRRYARAGRWWNQLECGNHYYRAMSSWCTLVAATGFKPDVSAGRLQIAPPFTNLTAPWFSSQAFGVLAYAPQELTLSCLVGQMELQTLVTPVRSPQIRLNNRMLSGRVAREAKLWRVDLDQPVTLKPKSKLVIVG